MPGYVAVVYAEHAKYPGIVYAEHAKYPGIGGHIGDARIFRVLSIDDRDAELADQRHEGRGAEAVVAHLDDVAQPAPVERLRQQLEESAKVGLGELLERRELPEQGTEAVTQLGDPRIDEALDRVAGLAQDGAVGGETRRLDREHEA